MADISVNSWWFEYWYRGIQIEIFIDVYIDRVVHIHGCVCIDWVVHIHECVCIDRVVHAQRLPYCHPRGSRSDKSPATINTSSAQYKTPGLLGDVADDRAGTGCMYKRGAWSQKVQCSKPNQNDGNMSKRGQSQWKGLPVAKAGTIWAKINKAMLEAIPNYKVNIYKSFLTYMDDVITHKWEKSRPISPGRRLSVCLDKLPSSWCNMSALR